MEPSKFANIESQEAFKDLFDHAHDLIHIVDLDGRILYVNNAWEHLLKYSQDEVRDRDIYSIIEEHDAERFKSYRESVIDGTDDGGEFATGFKARDGHIIKVEGAISVKRVDGLPVYTRGIFHDITRRIQDEESLLQMNEEIREREFNLNQILLHAPDGIIVIDASGIILLWNPKSEQIFGWKSDEVVGTPLDQTIVPERFREGHNRGMERYLATGEERVLNTTIELSALDKSGREFFISLTVSKGIQQGRTVFISFLRDIDQQKRNQLELDRNRMDLEHSNHELERFAHVTSHDMQEPVRKIRLFTEKLEDELAGNLSDRAANSLEKIKSSAKRMTDMINAILAYSSVGERGREIVAVDLNQVVEDVKIDLEILIEEKEATIIYDPLPVIEGIPILIHQLIYNLINNALKFSHDQRKPLIAFQSTALAKACSYAPAQAYEIKVIDNGIGIEPQQSDFIFQTFSRLHAYGKYQGTGLGLALCKRIVEIHNGSIKAENNENGTTISFTLPRSQNADG